MGDEILKKLPEGWRVVRLGELIGFKNGKSYSLDNDGMYPIYGSNGLIGFSNDYFLDGTFILIGRVGASGEVHFVSGKFWASDNCLIGICNNLTIPTFIYYLLKFMELKKFITQTAQPLITQSFISSLHVFLPPLPEQRKIAEILETADKAIEKTDAVIEKYRRIKQGLMRDLLTKGIDEKGQIRSEETHKFRDSPLGRIPEEWEVAKLGNVSSVIMGQSPSSSLINKDEKGLPFLQGNAEFTCKYPNPTSWIEKPLKIANKGSILVSVRAPIGDLNFANSQCCIGRGLASIEANGFIVDNNFLWYSIHFFINELIKIGQGSTFEAIGCNELRNLCISLPPLPEQRRIASVLSQIDEVIEKEERYKEKLGRIKQGLMQDLLTGEVRVNHLIKET